MNRGPGTTGVTYNGRYRLLILNDPNDEANHLRQFVIAVGGVGIAILHGQDLAQYHIKATNLLAVGLGAAIFGVGMVLFGYCPGTGLAAVATGRVDALAGLAGMMVGGIAYALTFDWVAANILPVGAYGKLRLPELLGLPEWVCYAGLVVMTISVFALVNKAEKKA
jgi:uncharacterized membrane protein YedE/YeeE